MPNTISDSLHIQPNLNISWPAEQPTARERYEIVKHSRNILRFEAQDYALANAPRSLYAALSANKHPGSTRITWLAQRYKCNQFVGEALTRAGFKMPTFIMHDGTKHFLNAELLPRQSLFFQTITKLTDLSSGDLIVIDYPTHGEDSAHVEIISSVAVDSRKLISIGAHKDGVSENDNSHILGSLMHDQQRQGWRYGESMIYFLRPTQRIQ